MNVNQLLIVTILLFLYINHHNKTTYENFEGQITKASCIERMLNYECIDEVKREELNEDCSTFEIMIPSGLVRISCDDSLLFDTLLCNKMISEGACDCAYGRKQINGICDIDPINISCPAELQSKDLAIIEKINDLQDKSDKCVNVYQKEKELFNIANSLRDIMIKGGLVEESSDGVFMIIPLIFIIIGIGLFSYIYQKKKK